MSSSIGPDPDPDPDHHRLARPPGRRTDHPRRVLVRRLAALLVIGLVHQMFHLGEALVPHAVFGLVLLLPASLLTPRVQIAVGGDPAPGGRPADCGHRLAPTV